MVMQDPKYSLNPVMTIGDQMVEAYLLHDTIHQPFAQARTERRCEMLEKPYRSATRTA